MLLTQDFVDSCAPGTELTFNFQHPGGCCSRTMGGVVLASVSGNIVKDYNGMNLVPPERYSQYEVIATIPPE